MHRGPQRFFTASPNEALAIGVCRRSRPGHVCVQSRPRTRSRVARVPVSHRDGPSQPPAALTTLTKPREERAPRTASHEKLPARGKLFNSTTGRKARRLSISSMARDLDERQQGKRTGAFALHRDFAEYRLLPMSPNRGSLIADSRLFQASACDVRVRPALARPRGTHSCGVVQHARAATDVLEKEDEVNDTARRSAVR